MSIQPIELIQQQQNFIGLLQETIAQQTQAISNLENKLSSNITVDAKCKLKDMPLLKLLADWLAKRKPFLQPNTYQTYQAQIRNHFYPYFVNENISLQSLTSDDIEEFYSYELSTNSLSPNTVIRLHALLHSAMLYAEEQGFIITNPMRKVKRPKSSPFIPNVYDADMINKLFIAARHLKIYPAIVLAATLGLRRSEVAGLTWENLNMNAGVITIKQKIIMVDFKEQVSKRLKTETSYRCLTLPQITLDYLKRLKEKQDALKKLCIDKDRLKNFKFVCVDDMGVRITLEQITDLFRNFIAKEGNRFSKIRFHDLRHSCACILLNTGCNMKQVQEWLGHSNFAFTAKVYIHLTAKEKEFAAIMLNRALNMPFDTPL